MPTEAPPITDPTPSPDNQPEKFEAPPEILGLMKNLGMDVGDSTEPGPEPTKPKEAPKPDKPAETPKSDKPAETPKDGRPEETPKPEERPVTLRRQELKRPALPVAELPKPKEPAVPQPEAIDPEWEKGLEEDERDNLDAAREAERLYPDKYKGLTARTAKFIKDHIDLTKKPEFDDQDPKYQQWLQANQPRLSRREIREIEEARVAQRLKGEYDSKLDDVKHRMFVREREPQIEAEAANLFAELTHTGLPEEIAAVVKKDGFAKAKETFGLELTVAQTVMSVAADDLKELRRISERDPETGRPLQAVLDKPPTGDPDDPTFQREMARFEQHKRLTQLVGAINEDFKKSAPITEQVKNGAWFVTRDEMARIPAHRRFDANGKPLWWTFSNREIIERAKKNVPAAVRGAIEAQREHMKKLGWQPSGPKAPPPPPPKDTPPPRPQGAPQVPAATPVPGGGDPMPEIDERIRRLASRLNQD